MTVQTNLGNLKKNDEWETPQDFFLKYDKIFNFTLDVAASKENAKCERFFTKEQNGLEQSWKGETCWMNPPYSEVAKWMKKAHEESENATIVSLVFAKTDTRWFHELVYGKCEIEFIKGRIKFGESKQGAPYPSMIVVFGKSNQLKMGKDELFK